MIQLKNLSKSWDDGKTFAVKNVSLEVPDGKVLALLGGSGSGKSTTVKMINRLIEPTSGSILVGGEDITHQDPVQLRRRIGYVFQSIGLLPHMNVADNVTLLLKLQGMPAGERAAKANQLLDMVDLPHETFAQRLPSELSGGQRQRVGFARALAAEPKVMLLDEPFGALDPVTRDTLQIEFSRLQRSLGLTAVIVTHDMAEALLLADIIAVMNVGEILRIGTPKELLQNPGDDYVAKLLETPRRHGELVRELSD
ncbi:glycine/betaine ABC transporter ATP-binding protein [Blastopirellula marina]|uniref:Glycine/betaine ABC transporter ATP-binding protein n=1 Tax=Blastopirellula marina TaxID=124 RepID=A0A2S8FXT8_9BACT|nr:MULTISPECIES: ATP-binding cassette domain-containing protein [Pirellulaceae]PQO36991.1 glycine/betaine ABC transporter ATP-binding protein [Blastopirellula marina]RCS53706.1 ATP-binding cassette domain-containing protein [Bremerella cremea]